MSNMSYCRFQNTVEDLEDCQEHIFETEDLSKEEERARARLIRIFQEIAGDFEDF